MRAKFLNNSSSRLFLSAMLLIGISVAPLPGGDRLQRAGAAETDTTSFDAGMIASSQGLLTDADILLRKAWTNPARRNDAATALWNLHKKNDFKLPVDEDMIRELQQQLGAGFFRYETKHFVILSDCNTQWTRAKSSLLERTRHQFYRVARKLKMPAVPHEKKLLCILFDEHDRYLDFAHMNDGLIAPWVAGYYATRSNRVVFFNDTTSPTFSDAFEKLKAYEQDVFETRAKARQARNKRQDDLADRLWATAEDLDRQISRERNKLNRQASEFSTSKTIHEAIHLLAFNSGIQSPNHDYPFWLSEGLAATFETTTPDNPFGPDIETPNRQEKFHRLCDKNELLVLERLVTLTEVPDNDAELAEVMYNQSYALVTYLFKHERDALARYMSTINDLPAGRMSSSEHLSLFKEYFGDLAIIEHRLERW